MKTDCFNNSSPNKLLNGFTLHIDTGWKSGGLTIRIWHFGLGTCSVSTFPLNNAILAEKTNYFSAYNELFINTTGRMFDRDRIYLGLGYNFTKQLKLELGFMSQRLEGRHRNQSVINFINSIPFKTSEQ